MQVVDMEMDSYTVCADLRQVVDRKMDSYMVCADLRQVVDMEMDSYMVCTDCIAGLTLVLPTVSWCHLDRIY